MQPPKSTDSGKVTSMICFSCWPHSSCPVEQWIILWE